MGAVHELAEAVQTGFAKVEDRFDGVETRLDGVARAVDKDAVTIINHERVAYGT